MSLQDFESRIREIISNTTVAQDGDIPFSNYAEFLRLEKEGQLRISSAYDGDLVSALGSKAEMLMHMLLVFSPFITAVTCVVLVFVLSDYWLLIGTVLALLGFFFSSPAIMRGFGSLLLVGAFIYSGYSCYEANWTGAILAGSYAFSNFFTTVAREQCRMVIHRSILESEPLFVWLHGNRKIIVTPKRPKESAHNKRPL